MKVITCCHKCTISPGAAVMMSGDLDNDLLAICTCPNGHRFMVHQAHSAPEVIYSAGVRAFAAGFYSESVVTLSAALERAYELFTKVFLLASGKAIADIATYWKDLESSSERQLGAFCSAYFCATGMPWKTAPDRASFRNKVAHKGYIATSEKAHDYGEYVTGSINAIIGYLKTHYNDALLLYLDSCRVVVYRRLEEVARRDPSIELCFAGTTAIEWNGTGYEKPTFDSRLAANSAMINQLNC
ncbi:hypothetical protein RKE25_09860 [Dyella sp. BiH032]|uniref:hypothetical protein n=1 Tax=Dyella sp. BiH032 TaxID=3075430 RepID=UPI0028937855|nr:hypothetical protein [Dyella sp. BiH032]WNL47904.1 hypothetical protein RKE25_09860 [Dyella sp. BiH032]